MRIWFESGWRLRNVSAAALIAGLAFVGTARAQQQGGEESDPGWTRGGTEQAPETAQADEPAEAPRRDMESAIYETWKDVLPKVKEEVEPDEGADKPLPEPEETGEVKYIPPVDKDPENSTAVMNTANPMVDAQCRAEVEDLHVKSYARLHEVSEDVAFREIRAHYTELRERMRKVERVTPGMVLHHIAECDEFCLPRNILLTSCHIYAVSQADRREIVFFDYDESFVRPEFWGPIRDVAEDVLAAPDNRLLLIGRASKPGSDDYNVALSHRRTARVIDMLREHGVPEDKMTLLTIGEYTPNLDRKLLDRYAMADAAEMVQAAGADDEFHKLNQSVLLVVYRGEEPDDADDHDHGEPSRTDAAARGDAGEVGSETFRPF